MVGVIQLVFSQEELILWINRQHTPWADALFQYLTWLGDGAFFFLICLVFVFYNRRIAMLLFVANFASGALVQVLKRVVFPDAWRPFKVLGEKHLIHQVEGVELLMDNSFPSGHTASAFTMCCMLSLFLPDKRWAYLLFGTAVLVGFSRNYLFQHFLIDVYAGSAIGVLTALLVFAVWQKQQLRRA